MPLRGTLVLIAYLCVLLWLARDYETVSIVFGLGVPSAVMAFHFVEHLKRRGRQFTLRGKTWAYSLAFVLSLLFLLWIPFVICLVVVGLIWLFTGIL
jgi:hypothetical protein